MSSALIYSVRFAPKLRLPEVILANIAKLRLVPATYRPLRPSRPKNVPRRRDDANNWRSKVLADYVRKVRETTDPQYDDMFEIFNKIAAQTMDVLSKEAIEILKSRDEQFRLRVTTLLFDKAIKGSAYAPVMADLAKKLNAAIPDVSEDLETHVQMFGTLYDMSGTLTFPRSDEEDFDNKVIAWAKQKMFEEDMQDS
jgi:hypothetical protein